MTKEEALKIPDLCIKVSELTEDVFYLLMADTGRISSVHKEKALKRMEKYTEEVPLSEFDKAQKMMENIDKYGIPCAEWCD